LAAAPETAKLNYDDAVTHFTRLDLSEQKKKIVTGQESSGFFTFLHLLFTSGVLKKSLIPERDQIFAIALISYDNSDDLHGRILQNVYMTLLDANVECPRLGPHWEEIGFQGDDPATDLRGVGMLGLLQLLFLVRSHTDLAKKIHKLSRHAEQNFPFSVVSLNFTKLILQTMRSGVLNKHFNKKAAVLPVINELLVALYYELFTQWQRDKRTITDFPPLLKQLSDACMKDPSKFVTKFRNYLRTGDKVAPKKEKVTASKNESKEKLEFSSI